MKTKTAAVVFKPPAKVINEFNLPTVFLAGAIDMGEAEDWQTKITETLSDVSCIVMNPRRDDWDSSWEQDIKNDKFRQQVEWELECLDNATLVVMCLTKDSKAPISLLELGLHVVGRRMLVFCPEGFYRKGNVDVVCHRYGIPVETDFDNFCKNVKARILETNSGQHNEEVLPAGTLRENRRHYIEDDDKVVLPNNSRKSSRCLVTAADRVAKKAMLRAFVTGLRYLDKPHLEIPQFPVPVRAWNICPVCGEKYTCQCKCSGPHSLEDLMKGHGLGCANGHRWSGDVVYNPNVKTAADANMAYDRKLKDVRKLINALQGLLDKHEARQGGRPEDWGFVGDLENLAGQLTEMVRFIGGGTKG